MSRTYVITRFIAYLPDAGDRGREEYARVVDPLRDSEFRLLRQEPHVLAVTAPALSASPDPSDWLLDVFPGTAASARLASATFDDTRSGDDAHQKAEASAQCYNLLQSNETCFVLESDALGLKPVYTARTPGGTIFGSRIADLLHLLPALAEPTDTTALYELLAYWAPLAGRTLHRQIRRTLPGGCYRWTPATGLSSRRDRDLGPTPAAPIWLMDQATEAIRDRAAQSLKEKTAGVPQPILLAFSGGFDSRLIAALCGDEHIRVRTVSYGRRHHNETRSARGSAKALGLQLQMLPQFRDGALRFLPQYLDVTEGTADPAAASIMNLMGSDADFGSSILHGFGGDVQAGIRVNDFSASSSDFGVSAFASHDSIVDAIVQRHFLSKQSGLRNLFSPAADMDEVRQDVASGLRSDCPPHEAYVQWFLEERTRRYVATNCAMLGEHFDVVMPFYDRQLFDLWRTIPPIGLTNRAVFKNLMARYYPKLARVPHSEEPVPISPNLQWQLSRFFHNLPRQLLAASIGTKRAEEMLLRLYLHHDFRSLGKLGAPRQRAQALSRIRELQPALKEGLGVELSQNHQTMLSGNLNALRSMLIVAEYAKRRCTTP